MSKIDWSKEQRQAPIGLIIFSIDTIQKLIRVLWPILIPIIVGHNSVDANSVKEQIYFYGTIAIVAFVMINSLLSYWFFKFQVIEGELLIKKGYLKKIRLSIPLDRIQTVNIKQNLAHKLLNLVAVEVDTAGGKETEVKLIAVKRNIADALKEELRAHSKIKEDIEVNNSESEYKPSDTVLALSLSDIIKVGISENHLRSFTAIMGVGYWVYSQIRDISHLEVEDIVIGGVETLDAVNISFYFWFFLILLMFIASVLFSFILSFIRFYELKLSKQGRSFKLSFGLIQTKEISVSMSKIQVISWHQNPLRQLLRFETLKIKQAVSGEQIKKKQAIEVPACRLSHQQNIKNTIFGETEPIFSEPYKSHGLYFIRNFVFMSLLFLLPTVFSWWQDSEYQITLIAYEILLAIYFALSYWRRMFRISESQLEITKGQVSKTIYQLQNFKIQAVKFKQNIFVERRGLANIVIYTASGDRLKIPYISERLANDLHRFLLYKIESTEEAWM